MFALALLTFVSSASANDWPRFLGPNHNATSSETGLLQTWAKGEPKIAWEFAKGAGHSCPSIVGNRLVLFHRIGEREAVDCLDAKSGAKHWRFEYAAPYRDRFGSGDGTRTSAVIDGGRVFVFGITGLLHCLDLANGTVVWKGDLAGEYEMKPNFFGHGSTPLVRGSRLIANIGGKDDVCCVALDAATGRELWRAKHEWGASYASPVPATIHGRECVLVFAGGESRPPTGGLLTIDAATGEVLNATPHRAEIAESVSASSPVFCPPNRVFVTESYGAGGAMIEIAPDFSARVAWRAEKFGAYWMTPVVKDGCIYGFDGQQPRLVELVCYDIASGRELWRDELGGKFGRGSLLAVDGAFLCLGEFGDLAWLELTPRGAAVKQHAKLFNAPETWTLPALSDGLLYVCQNERGDGGTKARVICYDLRGK